MHVRTQLATTAVLVLALTGCGSDDPEPKIQPTETVQPTETESPEPETPEEFIRRWNEEQTAMQQGNTTAYRAMVPKCKPCIASADVVDSIYESGGTVTTNGRRIVRITPGVDAMPRQRIFKVKVVSAPTTVKDAEGNVSRRLHGGPSTYKVILERTESTWVLVDYTELVSET